MNTFSALLMRMHHIVNGVGGGRLQNSNELKLSLDRFCLLFFLLGFEQLADGSLACHFVRRLLITEPVSLIVGLASLLKEKGNI